MGDVDRDGMSAGELTAWCARVRGQSWARSRAIAAWAARSQRPTASPALRRAAWAAILAAGAGAGTG